MIDVKRPLRQKYVELLTGLGYQVYDLFAPRDAPDTYIVINDHVDREGRTKCSHHISNITLEILARTHKNEGSRLVDVIADVVLNQITPANLSLAPTAENYSCRIVADRTLQGFSDTDKVYRRLIEIEHLIKEI